MTRRKTINKNGPEMTEMEALPVKDFKAFVTNMLNINKDCKENKYHDDSNGS